MSEFEKPIYKKTPTLCWDCAKAVLGCSWAREFIPVEGWTAEKVDKSFSGLCDNETYNVISCPEFVRDALYGGQKRWESK